MARSLPSTHANLKPLEPVEGGEVLPVLMKIALSATDLDLAIQDRAYIEYRMFSAIRPFCSHCVQLSVRVEAWDSSPPRAAKYRCSVVLDVMAPDRIRIRGTGIRLYAAIDSAADRLALATERHLAGGKRTARLEDRRVKGKGR